MESENNGNKWYDGKRVVWALFSLVGFLLGSGLATVWTDIRGHDIRIRNLEIITAQHSTAYAEIIRRLDRIEQKLEPKH